MNLEQTNWSKTLLNSYSYLETICGAIDKTVLNYGMGACHSNQTMLVANKIIALICRKKFLINTKVMVDKVLNNISGESAKILTVRYIDKVKTEIASQVLGLSNRTFFRKLNLAVDEFASELKKQGYSSNDLFEMFKNEGWIVEIYNSYCSKAKDKKEDYNYLGMAINSIKKGSECYGVCQ